MKKTGIVLAILFLSGCAAAPTGPITVSKSYETASSSPSINFNNKIYMKLTSPDFTNGGFLPADLSCQGQGRAPLLRFTEAPSSTVSLALIVDDPDAPGGVFTHWLVWNIPPDTGEINEKNLPAGVSVGTNSGSAVKYFPPCPPSGIHRYYFRLYALDEKLNLPAKTNAKSLLAAIKGHALDEAVLMGTYQRK